MFGAAIIVFRETLEAALFVGIIAAATRGLAGRSRCLFGGVLAGFIGALVLAAGAVTNTLILLLAAAIASQLARALAQAGVLNAWGQPLWDSSSMLRMDSALGTLAHALVGYEVQPTGMQLTFYLFALAVIVQG